MRIQSKHRLIKFNGKVESVQYSAALAVSGTWRGTSREKLYAELGWESLSSRRWSRHLTLFYKIINNLTPLYTKEPIPPLQQSNYSLRNRDVIGRIKARTEKFLSSFYPNYICEWSKLDQEIRLAPSVAVFKAKLLSKIRPLAKSIFCIHDPIGLGYLFQLRVGLSKLSLHKFNHNFSDTVNPMCPTNDGIEDKEHFLLLCPHLTFNDEIFSLEFRNCYDHLSKSIPFQTTFWYNTYCMVIKSFLMT